MIRLLAEEMAASTMGVTAEEAAASGDGGGGGHARRRRLGFGVKRGAKDANRWCDTFVVWCDTFVVCGLVCYKMLADKWIFAGR